VTGELIQFPVLTLSDGEIASLSAAVGRHAILQAEMAEISKDVFWTEELILQHWTDGPKFGARPDSRFVKISARDFYAGDDSFEPPHRFVISGPIAVSSISDVFEPIPEVSGARPRRGALFGAFGARKRVISRIEIYAQKSNFRDASDCDVSLTIDRKIEFLFSDDLCLSLEIHSHSHSQIYLRYDSDRTWSDLAMNDLHHRKSISSKIEIH
jgi:hypothetical protein